MSKTLGKLLECDRCHCSVFLPWTGHGIEWSRDDDDSQFQTPPKEWGVGELHLPNGARIPKDLCPDCLALFMQNHDRFWSITREVSKA